MEIQFACAAIEENSHICAFFHDREEQYRTMLPFMIDGLARGDKFVLIINELDRNEHLRLLRDGGVDVNGEGQGGGQLELISWPKKYFHGGSFDRMAALEMLDDAFARAQRQGYTRTRIIADWALRDQPQLEQFIDYEARLNSLAAKYGQTIICVYDLSRVGGSAVLDAMRTHPLAVVGGVMQKNPFYLPPEQVLAGISASNGRCSA
jgi:hypothetical protein